MPGRFEQWVRGWRLAFAGETYRAFMGGLAAALGDRVELEARQAVKEGFATEGSDETALGLLGADVLLDRGPDATYELNYRDRVAAAYNQWRFASTPLGLLVALHYSAFPLGVVVQQNGRAWALTGDPVLADLEDATALPSWCTAYTLPNGNPAIPASTDGKAAIAAGTVPWWTMDAGMDADGNQWCGRFQVLFPGGLPVNSGLATPTNLDRIRRVIKKWKPASKRCEGIIVLTSGAQWGWPPTLVWGQGGLNWGGTTTTYTAE